MPPVILLAHPAGRPPWLHTGRRYGFFVKNFARGPDITSVIRTSALVVFITGAALRVSARMAPGPAAMHGARVIGAAWGYGARYGGVGWGGYQYGWGGYHYGGYAGYGGLGGVAPYYGYYNTAYDPGFHPAW